MDHCSFLQWNRRVLLSKLTNKGPATSTRQNLKLAKVRAPRYTHDKNKIDFPSVLKVTRVWKQNRSCYNGLQRSLTRAARLRSSELPRSGYQSYLDYHWLVPAAEDTITTNMRQNTATKRRARTSKRAPHPTVPSLIEANRRVDKLGVRVHAPLDVPHFLEPELGGQVLRHLV